MKETHYIPYFTRQNGRKYQAACGRYVLPCTQVPPGKAPTCPECLAYVEAAPKPDDSTTGDEDVDALFGPVRVGANVSARDPKFDVLAGYKQKGTR